MNSKELKELEEIVENMGKKNGLKKKTTENISVKEQHKKVSFWTFLNPFVPEQFDDLCESLEDYLDEVEYMMKFVISLFFPFI